MLLMDWPGAYFGYLSLVLPELDKSINELGDLQIDGAHFRDLVAENPFTEKMFIVLPKNCFCPKSFEQVDSRIKCVSGVKLAEKDRYGVARHVYKSTIYKVSAQNRTFYCLLEYALPLQTLHDMYKKLRGTRGRPKFALKELDQQVVQFLRKLKNILEGDLSCRGKYVVITVGDVHENLADVIVDQIMAPNILSDEEHQL